MRRAAGNAQKNSVKFTKSARVYHTVSQVMPVSATIYKRSSARLFRVKRENPPGVCVSVLKSVWNSSLMPYDVIFDKRFIAQQESPDHPALLSSDMVEWPE